MYIVHSNADTLLLRARIDEEKVAEMIACAMEQGINYYDTAWGYHDGNSELVLGKALSGYPRDSYYLATKFPGYDLSDMGKVEGILADGAGMIRKSAFLMRPNVITNMQE